MSRQAVQNLTVRFFGRSVANVSTPRVSDADHSASSEINPCMTQEFTVTTVKHQGAQRNCRRFALTVFLLVSPSIVAPAQPAGPAAGTGGALGALQQDHLQSVTQLPDFRSYRASSTDPNMAANGDMRGIEPGETLVLGDLEGPGVITHIWTTVASLDPFHGRSLVLRIYWDGAERPSVETPLGDFFGVGHGAAANFQSLPVAISSYGRARSCYWRMPFRKRARVTVTNESTYRTGSFYFYVDWQKHPKLSDEVAYFHAQYRQAMPAEPGDYTILETTGHGQYVGTVYSVHQTKVGWFGEGDDRFYVDGEEVPSIQGTGTEDYFGDAWGFRKFSTPFHGVSLWEGYFPGDRCTAYRWHLADPIAFQKSLKVTIEHKGSIFDQASGLQTASFVDRPDWISSVAFWYQSPAVGFDRPLPPAAKRVAPYQIFAVDDLEVRASPKSLLNKQLEGLLYIPRKGDAEIEFDFEVAEAGHYQLNAFLYHSVFGSLYQASLDGEPLGEPLDLCTSGADPVWVSFDIHKLEPGKHTLKFSGRGASSKRRTLAPQFFMFGLHYVILLRLEDMEGYQ